MRLYPSSSRLRLAPTRAPLSPSLSRAREPRASPLALDTHHGNTSVTLSPPSRYPFLSLRPTTPSSSYAVSLPRSPYLSHSIAASSVSLPRPSVSLSIAFDRAYISLTRLPLFFFPSLAPSALSRRVRLARAGAAKFGRTHAATCLRHLVQCVGGEREEIPRSGSFLH